MANPIVFEDLTKLWNELIACGGDKAEGIFRVSASKERLDKCKNLTDECLSECDVHLLAALMKHHLKTHDPVFPVELYEECIELGKKTSFTMAEIGGIMKKISDKNRAVIDFILTVVFPHLIKVQKYTHMDLDNLLIVFGPNMLRSKDNDVTDLLFNKAAMDSFLKRVMEYLPGNRKNLLQLLSKRHQSYKTRLHSKRLTGGKSQRKKSRRKGLFF